MKNQRTILNPTSFEGVGLHTGKHCKVVLRPSDEETGIVFFRVDRGIMIKMHPLAVVDTSFATTIGYNGTRIKTIEHLLATLSALEIDNIAVDIHGPEIPACDGSSLYLAETLMNAGLYAQRAPKRILEITRPFFFTDGMASISALPYRGRRFSQLIEFNNQFLGKQEYSFDLTPESFVHEIAPARTFGFLKDVEMLRKNGLARGGSLDNAVVIDGDQVLNPSGLRFKDEFVRHKILDCIGDLYLCGQYIQGHIVAERSGHSSNVKFLRSLLASPEHFTVQHEEPAPECLPAQI